MVCKNYAATVVKLFVTSNGTFHATFNKLKVAVHVLNKDVNLLRVKSSLYTTSTSLHEKVLRNVLKYRNMLLLLRYLTITDAIHVTECSDSDIDTKVSCLSYC